MDRIGTEGVQGILSVFTSPKNLDIENFLKNSAIDFSNRGITQTHLVFGVIDDKPELLGYFALANKILTVDPNGLSKSTIKRIERHAVLDEKTGLYDIPTPLIAQLGKNYTRKLNEFLNGSELLETACGKVADIQRNLGGRLTYIECENTPKLIDFYLKNDFRLMDRSKESSDDNLIQMIKYL